MSQRLKEEGTMHPSCYAGLIGKSISRSLSPSIHNSWFKQFRMNCLYRLLPADTEADVLTWIEHLCGDDRFLGLNVTAPYKEFVTRIPGIELSGNVVETGAANTLFKRGGKWWLENTDVIGVRKSVEKIFPDSEVKFVALVLGSGGSALAVAHALKSFKHCVGTLVSSREPNEAQKRWAKVSPAASELHWVRSSIPDIYKELLPLLKSHSLLVINTIPLGHNDEINPLAESILQEAARQKWGCRFFDLIYRDTAAVRRAREVGVESMNGLHMLKVQASESFCLWTGVQPEIE